MSLTAHIRATLALGLPLAAAQLAQLAVNTTDTVMIGWLGARELAASVLATQAWFMVFMLGSGFLIAVIPIAAQAEGRGDARGARRAVRMGLWFALAYSTLAMPALWHADRLLVALGQDPAISALAGDYMRILQWSLYPALLTMGIRSFLTARGFGNTILLATLAGVVLNAYLGYALIFGVWGAPALGLAGAASAAVASAVLIAAILAFAAMVLPGLAEHTIFQRFWRADWPALGELLRLGWPISATIIAEVGLFAAASILIGWTGTEQLAAHGIALQLSSIAFMIPLGLSQAATVRVGQAAGRGDATGVQGAALGALAVALGLAFVSVTLFLTIPGPLVGLFLDEALPDAAAVAGHAVGLLAIAAGFQFFDSLQVTSVALLRGVHDTRTPMAIAVFSYWGIGLPAAWLAGFPLGLGAPGVWMGLASGLAFASALLTWRFFHFSGARGQKKNHSDS